MRQGGVPRNGRGSFPIRPAAVASSGVSRPFRAARLLPRRPALRPLPHPGPQVSTNPPLARSAISKVPFFTGTPMPSLRNRLFHPLLSMVQWTIVC